MTTKIRGVSADFNSTETVLPKPSASVLLIRDGENGLEVFMLKRNESLSFSPGFWVFPGGALDPDEQQADMSQEDETKAFQKAAIRETFEESRFLLANNIDGQALSTKQYQEFLQAADWPDGFKEHGDFSAQLGKQGLMPSFEQLHYLACWITPKQAKKRFLTRFFIATAPASQEGSCDGGETTASQWQDVGELSVEMDEGKVQLMFPTEMNCRWLNRFDSVAEVLVAMKEHSAPEVTPRIEKRESGIWLNIPEEAGYGLTEKFMQS